MTSKDKPCHRLRTLSCHWIKNFFFSFFSFFFPIFSLFFPIFFLFYLFRLALWTCCEQTYSTGLWPHYKHPDSFRHGLFSFRNTDLAGIPDYERTFLRGYLSHHFFRTLPAKGLQHSHFRTQYESHVCHLWRITHTFKYEYDKGTFKCLFITSNKWSHVPLQFRFQ